MTLVWIHDSAVLDCPGDMELGFEMLSLHQHFHYLPLPLIFLQLTVRWQGLLASVGQVELSSSPHLMKIHSLVVNFVIKRVLLTRTVLLGSRWGMKTWPCHGVSDRMRGDTEPRSAVIGEILAAIYKLKRWALNRRCMPASPNKQWESGDPYVTLPCAWIS